MILTSILPIDEASRPDRMAWTAYFAVALTAPGLLSSARDHPTALQDHLTALLVRAQEAGDLAPGRDPRTEIVALLALTNGLSDSVLGGQRDADAALSVLAYQLDRVFDVTGAAGSPDGPA